VFQPRPSFKLITILLATLQSSAGPVTPPEARWAKGRLVFDVFLVSLGRWVAPIGCNWPTHHFATHSTVASAWLWTVAAVGGAGYHIYLTVIKLT
jgi:hypothetical protein